MWRNFLTDVTEENVVQMYWTTFVSRSINGDVKKKCNLSVDDYVAENEN